MTVTFFAVVVVVRSYNRLTVCACVRVCLCGYVLVLHSKDIWTSTQLSSTPHNATQRSAAQLHVITDTFSLAFRTIWLSMSILFQFIRFANVAKRRQTFDVDLNLLAKKPQQSAPEANKSYGAGYMQIYVSMYECMYVCVDMYVVYAVMMRCISKVQSNVTKKVISASLSIGETTTKANTLQVSNNNRTHILLSWKTFDRNLIIVSVIYIYIIV